MRFQDPEIDILSIVRNNNIVYVDNKTDHLFLNKDGYQKLDGRVVRCVFNGQFKNEITEFFVALDEVDAYTLFTMQIGIEIRLDYITKYIFNHFKMDKDIFAIPEEYATECFYSFRTYKKNETYFMINNYEIWVRSGLERCKTI